MNNPNIYLYLFQLQKVVKRAVNELLTDCYFLRKDLCLIVSLPADIGGISRHKGTQLGVKIYNFRLELRNLFQGCFFPDASDFFSGKAGTPFVSEWQVILLGVFFSCFRCRLLLLFLLYILLDDALWLLLGCRLLVLVFGLGAAQFKSAHKNVDSCDVAAHFLGGVTA